MNNKKDKSKNRNILVAIFTIIIIGSLIYLYWTYFGISVKNQLGGVTPSELEIKVPQQIESQPIRNIIELHLPKLADI